MTIGTRVSESNGVVSTANSTGFTVQRSTSNAGFLPFQVDAVKAYVSTSAGGNAATMDPGDAGLCTISGSGAVLTVAAPLASACPGAQFIVRSVDARAHVVTGSQEVTGSKVFHGLNLIAIGSTGSWMLVSGSKITLNGNVGASFVMRSDGVSWLVTQGQSGQGFAVTGSCVIS